MKIATLCGMYFFVFIFNRNSLLKLSTHRSKVGHAMCENDFHDNLGRCEFSKSRLWQDFQRSRNIWLGGVHFWTLAELNLPTGCLPFMLPLLPVPVSDATSDKGAITGVVGVGGSWLFLTDLAAAIIRDGWIDILSLKATRTTPSMGVGRLLRSFLALGWS